MAQSPIEQVEAFLCGVAAGDPDLATRSVDPGGYVEHDPAVTDGAEGLRRHVATLPKDGPHPAIVRMLRDDPFVVVQTQDDAVVRFETFRFDRGLIAEHWAFSAGAAPPNKSGHTQFDGPTEPRALERTEPNKRTVRDYYETVHLGGRHDAARRWFAGDLMIRHEPGVADGVDAFLSDLAVLTRDRTIDAIWLLIGEGDLVFLVAEGTHRGEPCAYVDLYRVAAGKIVEHWGFQQPFPAAPEHRNDNGLL